MRNPLEDRPQIKDEKYWVLGEDAHFKHEEYACDIEDYFERLICELVDLKKTQFKEGKFYCSGFSKEERWGSIWCCNLINEILGVGDGSKKENVMK